MQQLIPLYLLPYMPFIMALIGACIGSFITMASHRIPLGQGIVFTASHCPKCSHKLGFSDLFPILSWVLHNGQCRYCHTNISIRYPLIEITTAFIFFWVYHMFGLSPFSLIVSGMAAAIILMIVTDLEHYIIPDSVQIALTILAIAHAWLLSVEWQPLLIGGIAGFIFGYILCVGYPKIRGIEGLGFGDVKFFAVAGLWLGWMNLIPFFVCSGFMGVALALIWRLLGRGKYFPFGPALGISLFLFVAFPEIPFNFWQTMNDTLTNTNVL